MAKLHRRVAGEWNVMLSALPPVCRVTRQAAILHIHSEVRWSDPVLSGSRSSLRCNGPHVSPGVVITGLSVFTRILVFCI